MDVLATTCLVVIAITLLATGYRLHGLATEARRSRRLLEDIAQRLGTPSSVAPTPGNAPEVEARRSWMPADA